MDYPADPGSDPWNTPDLHKDHDHDQDREHDGDHDGEHDGEHDRDAPAQLPNGAPDDPTSPDRDSFPSVTMSTPAPSTRPISFANPPPDRPPASTSQSALPGSGPSWGGYYEPHVGSPGGFGDPANPFGGNGRLSAGEQGAPLVRAASGRTGNALEEVISVGLMPEKEGFFLFQHHNYEVSSSRRGSKVVRRYSDFVWLLECLHKRYPFRALPPLPPKRVAGELLSLLAIPTLCHSRVYFCLEVVGRC